jgi:hypothetical protein
MKPGRELDALVAEKVFNYSFEGLVERNRYWVSDKGYPMFNGQTVMVPFYSTDIAAAWQVVEKLSPIAIEKYTSTTGDVWSVRFCDPKLPGPKSHFDGKIEADTAPHAICLAALRALSHEPKD